MSTKDTGGTPDDPVAEHESIRVGPGSDWNPDDALLERPDVQAGLREAIADETVPMPDLDEGYDQDDPKHPSWRERLAAIWDSRPGK